MAALSDYTRQLSVPILGEQTMNEWFAERNGFDVPCFGIVDEGAGQNGIQYNFICGEGTKHGSNEGASLVHYSLDNIYLKIGSARKIHFQSDVFGP